jgi:hypothetical protein
MVVVHGDGHDDGGRGFRGVNQSAARRRRRQSFGGLDLGGGGGSWEESVRRASASWVMCLPFRPPLFPFPRWGLRRESGVQEETTK